MTSLLPLTASLVLVTCAIALCWIAVECAFEGFRNTNHLGRLERAFYASCGIAHSVGLVAIACGAVWLASTVVGANF
jgi:hypothetical protein